MPAWLGAAGTGRLRSMPAGHGLAGRGGMPALQRILLRTRLWSHPVPQLPDERGADHWRGRRQYQLP